MSLVVCVCTQGVDVLNPAFDYVPPELVTLFITNSRGLQPSYVYRILAEYFSPEDYAL
jgi:translation initiation factor eIF-2B subunit beta